ncbi:protein ssh4 [Trifolium pratense]|uniref:Protein ssh4 n=1 Tax=Trifolium pratense TaxID=57577 RepID=A0A2K3N2A1_TRIPR|nr:protein ssh4 [Trifolium pratense]
MAADAVENGWSRFAFTSYKSYMPSPSMRATLLGSCVAPVGDNNGRESSEAEISWEVSRGSDEFMQKVRTALPLPGPVLGNCVFPQESYFEITILYSSRGDEFDSIRKSVDGGDKTKLIAKGNSEALVHVTSGNGHKKINSVEEMKVDGREGGKKNESVMFSMGLTIGGPVLLKVPGSYPGSIGFNSNGSVYLDGMKLVFESEKAEWIGTDKVIGCGFDPRQKKVFFTLDSELMHVIHCQTEEFSTPLYPTLAANIDIMVLVNFGQNAFKYAPANAQRTPNPCFVSPLVNSPTIGYDDSKELFSMGRIDSQWHNRTTTKGSHNNNSTMDSDEESDADLFEIVIDRSGKSSNTKS